MLFCGNALAKVVRMHRVTRVVIWLLAILLGALLVLLLGVNLYVQSQGTQARIQQELSQRLGMPLRINRISVTPWSGLQLTGITIPQADNPNAAPFLRATSFHLHVRYRSIFSQPLVIKEIALIKPAVTWAQNDNGKWRLPLTLRPAEPEASQPEASATPVVSAPPLPKPTATSSLATPSPIPKMVAETRGPQIKKIKLVDGSFYFLDHEEHNVALFEDVDFSSSMREGNSIRGEARVKKISLRDRFFLSSLRSPIRYDPSELNLTAINARIAGGTLAGSFEMQPQAQNSPFTVQANFKDVQAEELLVEAGGPREMVRGRLEGNLHASGQTARPDALTGEGTIALHDGHVQQFGVLAAIGQLLQIEELTRLDLQKAEAKYRIANGAVSIDELVLQSPNLRLNATGSVTFKGKLALQSVLTINEKIRGQLFRGIRENFLPTAEAGEYALQFQIGGSLEKPKTDLMERAVGKELKDLGTVFDALLGRGKVKKKKKAETPAPEATVSPLPEATVSPTP